MRITRSRYTSWGKKRGMGTVYVTLSPAQSDSAASESIIPEIIEQTACLVVCGYTCFWQGSRRYIPDRICSPQ